MDQTIGRGSPAPARRHVTWAALPDGVPGADRVHPDDDGLGRDVLPGVGASRGAAHGRFCFSGGSSLPDGRYSVLDALVPPGWLRSAQAAILKTLSGSL
jgi:hypothetical protein